jgi:hypothetical protein
MDVVTVIEPTLANRDTIDERAIAAIQIADGELASPFCYQTMLLRYSAIGRVGGIVQSDSIVSAPTHIGLIFNQIENPPL